LEYILETKKLSFFYKGRDKAALEDVNIKIRLGVKTVILGANGAGKSTLFYHFNGVYQPSTGLVYYNGKLLNYRRKALRILRSEVAVVLQNPDDQIFSSTVGEDVAFGPRNMGLSEDEIEERVNEALFQTGMTALKEQGTLKLSYGQRKRLVLAGAIAMRPKLLILDEPTAGLDPQMAHEVMEIADQLHHTGTTVLISTHDVDLAYEWADEINVLRMSKLIYSGNSEDFYSDPKLVHMTGLMPPSMYSINKNYVLMIGTEADPYPKSLPELVSKLSKNVKMPGKMVIISIKDSLTEEDMSSARNIAGDVRIGIYGTSARKAVFIGMLFSDYVFNGIDCCLIENVKGNNSILCCEDRMIGIVIKKLERLNNFGCDIGYVVVHPKE
jgi:cobalt/nickel transport system ATP-binding protein